MELARPARAEDRQACTRLLSQALVAAESMRGGAALVGDATTVSLLDRWTEPGAPPTCWWGSSRAQWSVSWASRPDRPRGLTNGLIECCYVETGARGVGVGTALMEAAVAWCAEQGCDGVDALALPGTGPPSNGWKRPDSPPAC